jgi:putative oxidoreductase
MFSKIALVSRFILGLMFTIFGLNGVMMSFIGHGFIPMPPPPAVMQTIMAGFMATGYIMPLAMLLELFGGLLLLSGFFMNAAIVFLGPVIVNILGIHLFAEKSGLPMAIIVVILFVILIKSRWSDFKILIKK